LRYLQLVVLGPETGWESLSHSLLAGGEALTHMLISMAQLTELKLLGCLCMPGEMEAGVVAALPEMPHLCKLRLCVEETSLPAVDLVETSGQFVAGQLLTLGADLSPLLRIQLLTEEPQGFYEYPAEQILALNVMAQRDLFGPL
jgi:hypothetical protein